MRKEKRDMVGVVVLAVGSVVSFLLLASQLAAASPANRAHLSSLVQLQTTSLPRGSMGPGDVIGRHCGGIATVSGEDDWCGCTWGTVTFQDDPGHPLEGVTVEIHYGGDYLVAITSDGVEEEFPYFAESADRLGAKAYDTLTLVASWGEYQTSLDVIAVPDEQGEQRVDLVFPFPRPATTPPSPQPTATPYPEGWSLVKYDLAGSYFYPYSTTVPISNEFTRIWSREGKFEQGLFSVGTGDVNGDGWLEIAVIDGDRLRLFDHGGKELWSRDIPGIEGLHRSGILKLAMLTDATGDGSLETFVMRKTTPTEVTVYVYDGDGDLLPSWSGSTGTTAVAADGFLEAGVLLDGQRMLMPIEANYRGNPRGAFMVDVTTGSHLWTYQAGWALRVSMADMDGDGIREMVNTHWAAVHNGAFGCGLGWNTCTDDSHLWVILLDENGREIFTRQLPDNPEGGELTNRIVDLDGDGQKEILVVEGHIAVAWHQGTSRIFLLSQQGVISDTYVGGLNVQWRLVAVADLNSDGYDEFVVQHHPSGIEVFDRNLDPVAWTPNYKDVFALNDINGDGQIEIIAASPMSHELAILGPDLHPLWRDDTFDGIPGAIVSDLTNDGINEIIAHTVTEMRIYEHQGAPLPTPTGTVTVTQPGRTLILVNEDRLEAAYASEPEELAALHQLTSTLQILAAHSVASGTLTAPYAVSGTIVYLDDDPGVVAAYDAWLPDPKAPVTDATHSNVEANAVADAILSVIQDYVAVDPTYRNIVLVGDDRIIPFRRVPDASPPYFLEGTYNSIVVSTTIGAALAENYILTDDFYGDLVPNGVSVPVTYVPDHPVGRLVERPSEMLALVDAFLARDGLISADPALVVGHDLVVDTANAQRAILQGDGITPTALIGDGWTAAQFRYALLEVPHNLSAINTHARHNAYAAPSGIGLQAQEVVSAAYPTSGTVAFSPGCHAGLNVPPGYGPRAAVDFPEAFAGRGIGYVANTGWGIGDRSGLAYSEALVAQLMAQFVQGESVTLGEALVASKLAYIAGKGFLDGIDEKVLLQFALYGLPMYRLVSGTKVALAGAAHESTPPLLERTEASDPDLTWVTTWYQPNEASFEPHSSPDGTYYTLDGEYQIGHNNPLEPRRFVEPHVSGGMLHGATFRGGIYSDTEDFDPVIATASIITGGVGGEGVVTATNWYPAIPFRVLNIHPSLESRKESFVVQFGQFRPADDKLRLFSRMSFDLFYSTSEDFTPPSVVVSSSLRGGRLLQVQAVATDISGIHAALVAFSANDGHWRFIKMIREEGSDVWRALVPVSSGLEYIVQVVDGAGNVTIDDNAGLYHRTPYTHKVHLPLVLRNWP